MFILQMLIGSRYLRMHGMCFTYLLSSPQSSFRFEKKVGIMGFVIVLVGIFTHANPFMTVIFVHNS